MPDQTSSANVRMHSSDIGDAVYRRLLNKNLKADDVKRLIDAVYFASIETEERRKLRFSIAVEHTRSEQIESQRRTIYFKDPLELKVELLVKLAQAIDSRQSVILVSHDCKRIVGIAVLGHSRRKFCTGEQNHLTGGPIGLLVTVLGPAHLTFYEFGVRQVLEYRNGVCSAAVHVFDERCPIYSHIGAQTPKIKPKRSPFFAIISRIQKLGNGGTLIITSPERVDSVLKTCKPNYKLNESELLKTAVNEWVDAEMAVDNQIRLKVGAYRPEWDFSNNDCSEIERNTLAEQLWRMRVAEKKQAEMVEYIHAIASLAAIDGALLMTTDFTVVGFGMKIHSVKHGEIFRARDSSGRTTDPYSPAFGTRHRSAASLAGSVPGTVVFVVSEDGIASAFFKKNQDEELTMWRPIVVGNVV